MSQSTPPFEQREQTFCMKHASHTLISGLHFQFSEKVKRRTSMSSLPLAINVFGPMAFKKNGKVLDIWLPILSAKYPHQAAVGTDVDSHVLEGTSEYSISDPNPCCHPHDSSHYNPPKNQPSVPYEHPPKTYPPNPYFVHVTLPRPKWIAAARDQ